MGNHTVPTRKSRHSLFSPVLNPNSCTLGNGGKDSAGRIPSPRNSACRDERSLCRACYSGVWNGRSYPGRMPVPDATSCSGDFFYGAGLSGAFRSVRSYFVSSNRSRMEDFFLSVILRTSSWAFSSSSLWRPLLMISSIIPYSRPPGLFPPCAVGFRLYRNGHDLPVDAGEQLRPLELFGVLLDYVRGQGRETLLPQAHQSGRYPPQCHKSPSARPRSQYQSSFRYVSFL